MPHVIGLSYRKFLDTHTDWNNIKDNSQLIVMFGGLPLKNSQVTSGGVGKHTTKDYIKKCEKKGIKFELNAKIEKIVEDKKIVSFNNIDQKVVCDALILSVGVIPNLDKDFISSLNLNLSDTGYINTNHNYETNIKGLYAIGDIIGAPWLAHKAMHDAINCVTHISTGNDTHKPKENHIPGCIYSLPQIATVAGAATPPTSR